MSTVTRTSSTAATPSRIPGETVLGWAVIVTSAWLIGGIWLDAWAHHNLPAALETFFTPWHGVLYSGFAATAAVLVAGLVSGRVRGASWGEALPAGYGPSLLGVIVFMAGGVGDMLWHLAFGIEVNLEALLSPTHLLLALGGALMVSGPFRAARARPEDASSSRLPMLLSLALTVSVITFFTEYANPFSLPWPAQSFDAAEVLAPAGVAGGAEIPAELGQMLGVTAILLQAGLLTGAALVVAGSQNVPLGSLTLLVGLNVGLAVVPHGYYLFIPAGVLGGLVADLLLGWLGPLKARGVRVFAFATPAVLFTLYFLTLALSGGVAWPVELWSGAVLLSGTAGLLLSYLLVPPATGEAARG